MTSFIRLSVGALFEFGVYIYYLFAKRGCHTNSLCGAAASIACIGYHYIALLSHSKIAAAHTVPIVAFGQVYYLIGNREDKIVGAFL